MTTQDFTFTSFIMSIGYTVNDRDALIQDFGLSEDVADDVIKTMAEIKKPWIWEN